jgi:hypothetical protein
MKLHVVYGRQNDLYAFYGRTDVPRCATCGNLTDKWNEKFLCVEVGPAMKMDISMTYDGVTVVTPRLVDVVLQQKLKGLRFHALGGAFSALLATRRVAFDTVARRTRFEGKCDTCGQYDAVTGATPAFLCPPVEIAPDEFVWTDVEFGSRDEKHPLLICGVAAGTALRRAKLKGLDAFSEVRGL